MLSPEIMTNLGPQEKIHRDPRQADNSHNTLHKANIIITVFLIEISGTMNNRDRQDSNLKNKCVFMFTGTVACTKGHQV